MTAPVWLLPDALFDGAVLRTGMALCVADATVVALAAAAEVPAAAALRQIAGTVTPGFVDLPVNGGGGVLLNTDPSVAGMVAIAAAHRTCGTVAILPTVITDAPEVLAQAADAAIAAKGMDGLVGLHIEGPHIALARRGTHAARFVRPLDQTTIDIVQRLRGAGVAVMITLAPEAVAQGQIAALAATGAVVSLGHSDATAQAVNAALAEGARCFTHIFNAMSQMQGREPGMVGAAINADAHAGIICDGHHVADAMIALALRARPVPDRMFLVSDAMPTVAGPDRFTLYGREVRLQDGRLVNGDGALAGAHLTMAGAVRRLIRQVGADPQTALRMAVTVPAGLIWQPGLATVEGRRARDLVLLDPGWEMVTDLATLAG
jgi:N-acetylglucosamine-6-phosphate deacetylase